MNALTTWNTYCETELRLLTPILKNLGYVLETDQPHLVGERFLMQAVTTASGVKLILLGKRTDGVRVIIKATRDEGGSREIEHEHTCREVLKKIDFAGEVFHAPEEFLYTKENGFCIVITRFIEQSSTFLERRLEEQYQIALRAFKGQESAHATTANHYKLVANTFGIRDAQSYLATFKTFIENVHDSHYKNAVLNGSLTKALKLLEANEQIISQYTNFLTHTDFVPHNIRMSGDTMYLLDHSSLIFGNKYEGWARFLNFMTLYNPPLERALVAYVRENRTHEELISLRMMRIFRLGEIIWYYIRTLDASTDNLLKLNTARVEFWTTVLEYILKDTEVPTSLVEAYKTMRDSLRSADEKKRQQGLH